MQSTHFTKFHTLLHNYGFLAGGTSENKKFSWLVKTPRNKKNIQ